MQSNSTLPSPWRIPTLDGARSRGIYVQFYDPYGHRYGIPTYPYHWAPKHLYTARQLRARGLRPGGQAPIAQILWRRGLRVAYLYRADLALPRRQATPAQLAAIRLWSRRALGPAVVSPCRQSVMASVRAWSWEA